MEAIAGDTRAENVRKTDAKRSFYAGCKKKKKNFVPTRQ